MLFWNKFTDGERSYFVARLIFIFLLVSFILYAQLPENLEQKLRADIEDSRLNDFSHTEAGFILSGVVHSDSLQKYLRWYNELVETIRSFRFDSFDRVGSASKVFHYLHATWLLHYKKESTTLLDIIKKKQYNCVSGTILYNLVCEDLGWTTEAFETPSHVYTIFTNFTQRVMVENTSSMGFNIMRNLREYSHYLAQFYPRNKVLKIGLDRLYAYENSKGRVINNTELLGLLAYNRAYFAGKDGDFDGAYDLVLLAQNFNQDSRSNVRFEIDLYYKWGKKLFDEGRYHDAFEVFADGYYRYPDVKDFGQNTRLVFFRILNKNWGHKNWSQSRQIIDEILDLEIMEETDFDKLRTLLQRWLFYFHRLKENNKVLEVLGYFQRLFPDDTALKNFKKR